MPYVTTLTSSVEAYRRQGKSLIVYEMIKVKLPVYKSVLVCCSNAAEALPRLRQHFPKNVMQIVPNCGIKLYQREFGK